jgi:hypothetical protein
VYSPRKWGGRRICVSTEENKAVLRREVEELYNHIGNLDAVEGQTRGIEGPGSSPPPSAKLSPILRTP